MNLLGNMITSLFDIILLPFGKSHQTLALVVLSLLTGVGMAYVFKWTSNQKAIKAAKDKLKGRILEMRIYQDDPLLIVRAFGGTIKSNVVYLGTLIKPFLILIVPVIIIFMQMDERFSRKPLAANERTILSVQLKEGFNPFDNPVQFSSPNGVVADTKPVRIEATREIDWRLRVNREGTHEVTLTSGGESYRFPVVAENRYRMIGKTRNASGLIEPLLHPGLPAIPNGSAIARVRIEYPGASYPLLWWEVHWIVIFLVYSLLAGLTLKFIIKFEI